MDHVARVGWVVDVQNDFARPAAPGGRLYVRDLFDDADPGAQAVEERVVRAVEVLRGMCDVMVFTGDWHGPEDEEIDPVSPDARHGTYPPHCMGRSEDPAERLGAEIIEPIRPEDPVVLDRDATGDEARGVARDAVSRRRPVFIRKDRFNVFEGNRATDAFLHGLAAALESDGLEFYVLGLARDVCVTQFIDSVQEPLRRPGNFRVVALSDCTAGLGLEPEAETLARWARSGARIVTLEELERSAPAK